MFVHELAADNEFKSVNAAKKAGYKNPSQDANRLLNDQNVIAAIGKILQARIDRSEITADQVLKHLVNALYLDPLECFNNNGTLKELCLIPEDVRRCIKKLRAKSFTDDEGCVITTVEIDFIDKDNCMALVMRHMGMLNEKISIKHEVDSDLLMALLAKVEESRKVVNQEYIESNVANAVSGTLAGAPMYNGASPNGNGHK